MNLTKIARCVLTDTVALFLALIIGGVAMLIAHVPPAVTLIQVLAVELLAQAFIISALAEDKRPRKPRQAARHQLVAEIIIFGALAAIIAYLNYRLFFVRHDLAPAYIDTTHPLYVQATTLAYVTLVLCQFMNTQFVRSDERKHFFTSYLWRNKKLVRVAGISFVIMLAIIYIPWLQSLFGTEALGVSDWIMALVAAALYSGARSLQRHTRQHTRHEIIKLHRKVHATPANRRVVH